MEKEKCKFSVPPERNNGKVSFCLAAADEQIFFENGCPQAENDFWNCDFYKRHGGEVKSC